MVVIFFNLSHAVINVEKPKNPQNKPYNQHKNKTKKRE